MTNLAQRHEAQRNNPKLKTVYLVIHCTATPEGREVTGNDIRHWHTSPVSQGGRGWKQDYLPQISQTQATEGYKQF